MATFSTEINPFANLFLVVEREGQTPALETDGRSDQPRRKRAHRKSRQGCMNCKQRRVKCDERVPCSNCTRRKEKCLRPARPAPSRGERIPSSLSNPKFESSNEPQLNLLHFELFSHFEKHTLASLSFPEVWPVLMRQAFHEEFVMSTILCVSATHLAVLNPRDARYSHASAQLLPRALRLLRQSLSLPFTSKNAHAFLGTSFLFSYISWNDLSFLRKDHPSGRTVYRLDLARDQLLLLNPGVLQVYFQALPILVADGNGYTSMAHRRPRLRIEKALEQHCESPARFVKTFMEIWDDPRYQTYPMQTDQPTNSSVSTPRSWLFYLQVIARLRHVELPGLSSYDEVPSPTPEELALAIIELNSPTNEESATMARIVVNDDSYISYGISDITAESSTYVTARAAYTQMARQLSPLMCCVSLLQSVDACSSFPSVLRSLMADLRQTFFAFPVLYCWPFVDLTTKLDSRALVLLFHFYRAARMLLDSQDSWWAHKRSRIMEETILDELVFRGLDVCRTQLSM